MIRAEMKKAWSRPMTIIALLFACLLQVFYPFSNRDTSPRELSAEINKMSGPMNSSWDKTISARYKAEWGDSGPSDEEYGTLSAGQKALLYAMPYTDFSSMTDDLVAAMNQTYGRKTEQYYSGLKKAAESGRLIFGISPAAESMSDQSTVGIGFLLFMLLFSCSLFAGERNEGMAPLQATAHDGRRRLFFSKCLACQISALIVWISENAVYALTLTYLYGWGNLSAVCQGYNKNYCPYPLSEGQFLLAVLLMGFAASQAAALLFFLLSYIPAGVQQIFALEFFALVLPALARYFLDIGPLALWIPCLMNCRALLDRLCLLQIGSAEIPYWMLAVSETGIIIILSVFIVRFLGRKAERAQVQEHELNEVRI